MHSLQATDGLIVEVYPAADDTDDEPLLKLRCLAMQSEDDPTCGNIIIWPEEIRHLVDALCTAAGLLAQDFGRRNNTTRSNNENP